MIYNDIRYVEQSINQRPSSLSAGMRLPASPPSSWVHDADHSLSCCMSLCWKSTFYSETYQPHSKDMNPQICIRKSIFEASVLMQ